MPKVSIITALCDRSPYLRPRVDSIIRQTFRDFEWIVIDDHSTDGTFERFERMTRSDRRVLLLRNAANIGRGPTTKKALELASGEYVYICDDDDACHPTFLERMTALLDAHPDVGLAHCRHLWMDAKGGTWSHWQRRRSYLRSGEAEFRDLLRACHVQSPSSIIRRAAADRAGVLQSFVPPSYVDYHCCLKVCLVSDAAFLGEPLAYYRRHPGRSLETRFRRANMVGIEGQEPFDLIDDVFAHLPDDRQHLRSLERRSLWSAADSLSLTSIRLRREGRGDTARALEAMIQHRLPDYPIGRLRPGAVRRARLATREVGLRLLERATYRPAAEAARATAATDAGTDGFSLAGAPPALAALSSALGTVPQTGPSASERDPVTVESVSVIVCVRDQAAALDACLARLIHLRCPERIAVEIVVVDNRSSDGARRVVEHHRSRSPIPLRYVLEPVQGLSRARNRGVRSARGELLAFLDADCLAASDWIASVCSEFEAYPEASIVGGRVELYDQRDRRVTIKTTKHHQLLTEVGQLDGFLHGCNLALRRSVVETIGLYDIRLGKGGPVPSAEDADLVYRGFRAGLKVIYSPNCVVHHDHGRRTAEAEHALRRTYRIGTGAVRMKHILAGDRAMRAWTWLEFRGQIAAAACAAWRSPQTGRRQFREIGHHVLGAILYLRHRRLASDTEPAGGADRNRDLAVVTN